MIDSLTLQSFKCFDDQPIRFRRLSIFAGPNASGKSSVIQAFLLLRQSHFANPFRLRSLELSGELFDAGSAKDVVNSNSPERIVGFELQSGTTTLKLEFFYPQGNSEIRRMQRVGTPLDDMTPRDRFRLPPQNAIAFPIFHRTHFSYLSAERLGPRATYPTAPVRFASLAGLVGAHGEFVAHVLAAEGHETLTNTYWGDLKRSVPSSESISLATITRDYLGTIVPGADIRAQTSFARVEYSYFDVRIAGFDTDYLRPANAGFGISYVLPIIVCGLALAPGSLLIVENPEAHLHPQGQSAMGEFLAHVAASGIQVIIETHSDHLLNGVRLGVKRGIVAPNDVAVTFFERTLTPPTHRVSELELLKDGSVNRWPKGFFDQAERDYSDLLGVKSW
jgi:predicted ATPase